VREQLQQAFDYLGFRRFEPVAALAPYLECFWCTGFAHNTVRSSLENTYPDGGCNLSIYFTRQGPVAQLVQNRQRGQRLFLTDEPCISARLHAGALFYLFAVAPDKLTDDEYDFSLLLQQPHKAQLQLLLNELTDWMSRWQGPQHGAMSTPLQARVAAGTGALHILQQWLLQVLMNAQAQRQNPSSHFTALQLLASPAHNVSDTAQLLGISSRTLARQLQQQAGFSPAYYQLCQRMKKARFALASEHSPLVEIALNCGFYDQAHFSHSFSRFVGETPALYRKRKQRRG